MTTDKCAEKPPPYEAKRKKKIIETKSAQTTQGENQSLSMLRDSFFSAFYFAAIVHQQL